MLIQRPINQLIKGWIDKNLGLNDGLVWRPVAAQVIAGLLAEVKPWAVIRQIQRIFAETIDWYFFHFLDVTHFSQKHIKFSHYSTESWKRCNSCDDECKVGIDCKRNRYWSPTVQTSDRTAATIPVSTSAVPLVSVPVLCQCCASAVSVVAALMPSQAHPYSATEITRHSTRKPNTLWHNFSNASTVGDKTRVNCKVESNWAQVRLKQMLGHTRASHSFPSLWQTIYLTSI